MQPATLPRNRSRSGVSGRAGICMWWSGVAEVAASAAEPNRGSSAPGAAKRTSQDGHSISRKARAARAGLKMFCPSPPHRPLTATTANTPPRAASQ